MDAISQFVTADRYRLGMWVSTQRQKKDSIPSERRALLDALGFVWDPREALWREGYEHLLAFRGREGHSKVPARFVTDDGYRLGQWVEVQRRRVSGMPIEQRSLLDELDFVWDPYEAAWREGYEHLVAFTVHEGHCVVHAKFYSADGYPLGHWVGNQRQKKNSIPTERRALLDALGFCWDGTGSTSR